jgi:hypothetical protein
MAKANSLFFSRWYIAECLTRRSSGLATSALRAASARRLALRYTSTKHPNINKLILNLSAFYADLVLPLFNGRTERPPFRNLSGWLLYFVLSPLDPFMQQTHSFLLLSYNSSLKGDADKRRSFSNRLWRRALAMR